MTHSCIPSSRGSVAADEQHTIAGRGVAVHAFTASGAVMGLAALQATVQSDYRAAFLWLIAATAVDGVDGWLARLARVGERAPGSTASASMTSSTT